MKGKIFFSLTLAAFCIVLTGCDNNDDINRVKALAWNGSATLTTGQALDVRKMCESTSWTSGPDDRGRTQVQYSCVFKDIHIGFSDAAIHAPNGIAKAVENIQWLVPEGDNATQDPVMTFFGVTTTSNAGAVAHSSYGNAPAVAAAITSNSTSTMKTYMQQIQSLTPSRW